MRELSWPQFRTKILGQVSQLDSSLLKKVEVLQERLNNFHPEDHEGTWEYSQDIANDASNGIEEQATGDFPESADPEPIPDYLR